MLMKIKILTIALILFPACVGSRSSAQPVVIKEKIKVSPDLMEECSHLIFASVENDKDCMSVLRSMINEYAKCANKLKKLQQTVKEYNQ